MKHRWGKGAREGGSRACSSGCRHDGSSRSRIGNYSNRTCGGGGGASMRADMSIVIDAGLVVVVVVWSVVITTRKWYAKSNLAHQVRMWLGKRAILWAIKPKIYWKYLWSHVRLAILPHLLVLQAPWQTALHNVSVRAFYVVKIINNLFNSPRTLLWSRSWPLNSWEKK